MSRESWTSLTDFWLAAADLLRLLLTRQSCSWEFSATATETDLTWGHLDSSDRIFAFIRWTVRWEAMHRSATWASFKPDSVAARRQSATRCRFVCLSMTEHDSMVIFARAPADWVGEGHAWGHLQTGHQSQRALASTPEKRQDFPRTLYTSK